MGTPVTRLLANTVWGGAWDAVVLTDSQVMLMLVLGPHLEHQGLRQHFVRHIILLLLLPRIGWCPRGSPGPLRGPDIHAHTGPTSNGCVLPPSRCSAVPPLRAAAGPPAIRALCAARPPQEAPPARWALHHQKWVWEAGPSPPWAPSTGSLL